MDVGNAAGPTVSADDTATAILTAAFPDLIAVYRFGSTASGLSTAGSDVDLAVLPARQLDPLARFDAQERIAVALGRSVDLVDLRRASTVMASQVVSTGIVLHDARPDERGRFEDYVYSTYARLNEERRGILDRVAAEGTVYGR